MDMRQQRGLYRNEHPSFVVEKSRLRQNQTQAAVDNKGKSSPEPRSIFIIYWLKGASQRY